MSSSDESELCFPHLLNSSCEKPPRSQSVAILTDITLSGIGLLTLFLNLLVIVSISHFRQLHTPTNILLLSLAVSDFFVGFLYFFQIMVIGGCWFLSDFVCSLYCLMEYVITSSSIGIMVLISVDRYVAICDPLHYSVRVTEKRVKVCVCLCWGCSVVYDSLLLKDNLIHPGRYKACHGECVLVYDSTSGVVDMIVSFICPITVIVVLYLRVFIVAASQARAMRLFAASVHVQGSVNVKAKKSGLKAAKTLGIVVVVFLICLFPYFCIVLTGQDSVLNITSAAFFNCLFYFNSCLNPIIYAYFYPWFRKSIKLIFTLQILKPGSCDSNVG